MSFAGEGTALPIGGGPAREAHGTGLVGAWFNGRKKGV